MKLVIFGASGGVGHHLVHSAASSGDAVTAVTRKRLSDVPSGVRVVETDVTRPGVIEELIGGHDAVLSSLGLQRRSVANPYSALTSPPDFCSASARAMVRGMKQHGVKRVVFVSAAGVGDSAPRMNALMRFFVATSNVGAGYRDLALAEQVFADAERADPTFDWCCPRPTRLIDVDTFIPVREVEAFGMSAAIPRQMVATWMLDRVHATGRLLPRTPQITAAPSRE